MPNGAIVISWGSSIPGREGTGLEVFGQALELSERYVKDGQISSHKEFFSGRRTGGFQILEGDMDALRDILASDEFQDVQFKAENTTQDLNVELYMGGDDESIQDGMGRYTAALSDIGVL